MKSIAWRLVRSSGLLGLWRKKNRYSIPILTAHGVQSDAAPGSWTPLWNRLNVKQLEHGLRVLDRYYDFIPLNEAVEILAGNREPRKNAMVLTFDDGYLNNYSIAIPVLKELEIPATFFVCPGMMETQKRFWIDRLDYAIQNLPPGSRIFDIDGEEINLNLESRADLANAYQRLRKLIKLKYEVEFDERVDVLASRLENLAGCSLLDTEEDDVWAGIMNWQQAKLANSNGFTIGSHTTDHVRLTLVSDEKSAIQLEDSRKQISSQLETNCRTIAYPNGDHSPTVRRQTREAGYSAGLTCDVGINRPGDDLFALKRINFPNDTSEDKILGIASGFRSAMAKIGI